MEDYNRISHSELLKSQNNVDQVVVNATNFNDFKSITIFLTDYLKRAKIYEELKILNQSKKTSFEFNIVDMCSGSGVFGVALAHVIGGHGTIHFVDIVGEYHETAKQLVKDILCDSYNAVTHTCSADNTNIISNTIDIIIESDGFHHCPSLAKVIKESNRILRSNGFLLGIDRIHDNYVTDEEIKELLDVEYSEEWLKKNNYKVKRLTRRQNGEGEIRFSEWSESLLSNNFEEPILTQYVKRSKSSFKGWLMSNMPRFLIYILFKLKKGNTEFHKNPRWSKTLLPTLIFGFNLRLSLDSHKLFITTFPEFVNTTLVRKQVLLSRSK